MVAVVIGLCASGCGAADVGGRDAGGLDAGGMNACIIDAGTLLGRDAGNGDGSVDCLTLAQEYADQIPIALSCDPNSTADQCSDWINTADYLVNGQQMTLDGLGSCMHSANPAHDARLKEILLEYSASCNFVVAPLCPGVFDRCYLNDADAGVCFQ